MRQPAGNPITVLRECLACNAYPELHRIAAGLIFDAVSEARTFGDACQILGVPRRGLERLRKDFPAVFP